MDPQEQNLHQRKNHFCFHKLLTLDPFQPRYIFLNKQAKTTVKLIIIILVAPTKSFKFCPGS